MPLTKLRPSFTFDEDRLAQLRAVVPKVCILFQRKATNIAMPSPKKVGPKTITGTSMSSTISLGKQASCTYLPSAYLDEITIFTSRSALLFNKTYATRYNLHRPQPQ